MAASEHQEGGDLPLRLQRKPDCRAGRVPVTVGLRLSKGGVVIVDQNTRLSRVLGIVTIPTSPNTGSVTHADFAQGLPWRVTTNGGVAGTYFNITPAMSFRSEAHTSEIQSLISIPFAVCRLKKNK